MDRTLKILQVCVSCSSFDCPQETLHLLMLACTNRYIRPFFQHIHPRNIEKYLVSSVYHVFVFVGDEIFSSLHKALKIILEAEKILAVEFR